MANYCVVQLGNILHMSYTCKVGQANNIRTNTAVNKINSFFIKTFSNMWLYITYIFGTKKIHMAMYVYIQYVCRYMQMYIYTS